MQLKVACPRCGKSLRTDAAYAGRKVLCPACGAPFDSPAAPAAHESSSPSVDAEPAPSQEWGDAVAAQADTGWPESVALAATEPDAEDDDGVSEEDAVALAELAAATAATAGNGHKSNGPLTPAPVMADLVTPPVSPAAARVTPASEMRSTLPAGAAAPPRTPPPTSRTRERSSGRAASGSPARWMAMGAAMSGLPLLLVLAMVLYHDAGAGSPPPQQPQHAVAVQAHPPAPHRSADPVPATSPALAPVPQRQAAPAARPVDPSALFNDPDGNAPATRPPADTAPRPPAPAPTAPAPPVAEADAAPATGPADFAPIPPTTAATPASPSDPSAAAPAPPSKPPAEAAGSDDVNPAPAAATVDAATRPADTRPVVAREPLAPTPIPQPHDISDEMIAASIRAGIDALARQFDGRTAQINGVKAHGPNGVGLNALCAYALLQAGIAVGDQRLNPSGELGKRLLDGVKELPIRPPGREQPVGRPAETYSRALRAACLALYNRPEDRDTLESDVGCLASGHARGAYTYHSAERLGSSTYRYTVSQEWDNSNSQYGVLGVWAGADVGVTVSDDYWKTIDSHWTDCQREDGQWPYNKTNARADTGPSMTAAGLATMFVIRDFLDAASGEAPVGRPPFPEPLAKGMRWWERGDNSIILGEKWWGYSLYGVERVGLASGFKYFGKHDWYRVLAQKAIGQQGGDGGWGDTVDTAYALLFLSRGRHPILMNKLRFAKAGGRSGEGFWANRPRDAANLARYASRQLERPLNWQVVDLKHEWHDWLDSPILSIASHKPIPFKDEDYEKIRRYVLAGGMVFTQADGDAKAFNEWVVEFAKKLFPQYEFQDLRPDHPVYSCVFRFKGTPPPLRAISNGSRILLLHSPADIAEAWQLREEDFETELFHLGTNIFVYAAGRRDLRNRLNSPYVPQPEDAPPLGRIKVARLRYAGNHDPEPGAWERYARLFEFNTGTGIEVIPVDWKELRPDTAPFAHLTGTAHYRPTPAEVDALRAYVEGGGVLLADACGGSTAFSTGLRDSLSAAFPGAELRPLTAAHPLLREGKADMGMRDLTKPVPRPYAADRGFRNVLPQVLRAGKGSVIFSNLDVTSGLLGTNTWGIVGYTTAYAEALMQNAIFWTLDGQPGA